jgi:hypothetical protein
VTRGWLPALVGLHVDVPTGVHGLVAGDVVVEWPGQPGIGSGGSHGPVVNSSTRTSR